MRLRHASRLVLAVGLCACVSPEVRINYPQPKTPEQEEVARTLSQVLLLFPEPADGIREFAASFDRSLSARGGELLAYIVTPEGAGPVPEALGPTAVAVVRLSAASVSRTESEREVKTKDSEGKEVAKKVAYVRRTARLPFTLVLSSSRTASVLTDASGVAEFSEEKTRADAAAKSDDAWLRSNREKLMRTAGLRAAALLPAAQFVSRSRPVFIDAEDPSSNTAAGEAFKGAWEAASALWAARMEDGRGGWRDLWNLALAAEARREYPEASRLYSMARDRAGTDPEASRLRFDEVLADLDSGSRMLTRSSAAAAYFARPTAVLPFSDDTTSVDGPENLRRLTAEALAAAGWTVIPLDEVDAALRRKGFSQGGQLKKTTPEKLASWTQAERLVFAHIAEFQNLMLGVIGRRAVRGTLRVWDAALRRDMHSVEKTAETSEAARGAEDAKGRFAAQLGKTFVENIRRKPLAEESAAWVERVLQGLPLRPPPRR